MRKIIKGKEPESLLAFKLSNPTERYNYLDSSHRQDIRSHCAAEQFYLCAYCCQQITGFARDTMNEHVEAQHIAPNRTLDFTNIVASCKTKNQCDDSHRAQTLPLSPLMDECETELKFKISGRVEGISHRAKETIRVLNLGDHERSNKSLIEKRKQLSDSLLWTNGIDPGKGLEGEALLLSVIDDLLDTSSGTLPPFAPVVANILRNWITP